MAKRILIKWGADQPVLPEDREAVSGPPRHTLPDGSWKPTLPDSEQDEATIAKLAYWLADEAVYMATPGDAVALSEDELEAAINAPVPWLYADERDAILEGNKRRLQGDKDAWLPVAACLRRPSSSPLFLATVADLLEMNLLRVARAGDDHSAESKAELVSEREIYAQLILAAGFESKHKLTIDVARRWAKVALAYNRRTPGESLRQAIERVVSKIGHGDVAEREARYARLRAVLYPVRKAQIRTR